MAAETEIDPELENLMLILAEHPSEKEKLIPRILEKLPWGCHPPLLIEKIENPENRALLRDSVSRLISEKKRFGDLVTLLDMKETEDTREKGIFLFAMFADDLDYRFDDFQQLLDQLAQPLKERLETLDNPSEKTRINMFIQYFFRELGFGGNPGEPYSVDNHYAHKVIKAKKGGAIVLCVLANSIARRAGLELPVVITAGHYLLRTTIPREIPFIDPFENGRVLTEDEHVANVAHKGYDPSIALLEIRSPAVLLQNLSRNLMHAAQMSGNHDLLDSQKEVRALLKEWLKTHD